MSKIEIKRRLIGEVRPHRGKASAKARDAAERAELKRLREAADAAKPAKVKINKKAPGARRKWL